MGRDVVWERCCEYIKVVFSLWPGNSGEAASPALALDSPASAQHNTQRTARRDADAQGMDV